MPQKILLFAGPSMPKNLVAQDIESMPPASFELFDSLSIEAGSIVILADSTFLETAAPTHMQLLGLMASGVTLIGVASAGALSAVELREQGMLGVGSVYNAYLKRIVTDDSEVAVAMCPVSFECLTVPLVEVRCLLSRLATQGVSHNDLCNALRIAGSIHYLERTPQRLLEAWREEYRSLFPQFEVAFNVGKWEIKRVDTMHAIEFARSLNHGHPQLNVKPHVNELFSEHWGKGAVCVKQ